MRNLIGLFASVFVFVIIINERMETGEGLPLYMVCIGVVSFMFSLYYFSNMVKKW
jgi:hypothetical protein